MCDNKHNLADKKSFNNATLADKGISHVGQLFDINVAMKPWVVFKSKFSLSKNSHFYWFQLNNANPKAWKENLYKGDKNFHFIGHHNKYQIYSLSKCNNKDLYSLQASLNESQIYFEKVFPNKEINWICIYLMPRRVTIDTKLRIIQYKILNKVLYSNEKIFKFKIFCSLLFFLQFGKWNPCTPFLVLQSNKISLV